MNSNVTITSQDPTFAPNNRKVFLKALQETYPELSFLLMALEETQVKPILLVPVVKMLSNLDISKGYGSVNIIMRDHVITHIKAEETIVVEESVTNASKEIKSA